MTQSYRQCELSRGKTKQTAYIPEAFAKRGQIVRLHDEDGWRVDRVGVHRVPGSYLAEFEKLASIA